MAASLPRKLQERRVNRCKYHDSPIRASQFVAGSVQNGIYGFNLSAMLHTRRLTKTGDGKPMQSISKQQPRKIRIMRSILTGTPWAIALLVACSGMHGGGQTADAAEPLATDPVVSHGDSASAKGNASIRRIEKLAGLFPDKTIAFVAIQPPGKIIDQLLQHPLRARIEAVPQVKSGLRSKEFAGFLAGLGLVQVFTGMEWEESLEVLAGNGAAVAVAPASESIGAVLLSGNKEKLPKLIEGLMRMANQGNGDRVGSREYRGITAYSIDKRIYLAAVEDRVVISNQKEFCKQMVDNCFDAPRSSLASSDDFQRNASRLGDKTAWAYLNLKAVRDSGNATQLFPEQTENIGVEFFVGGIVSLMKQADTVSAFLNLGAERLELSVEAPFQSEKVDENRQFFFGTPEDKASALQLTLPNSLANIYMHRDIGKLWLTKEELFDENHLSELSQADSTLSTLFSGLDFGEEVLGATRPGMQILARNQDYSRTRMPEPDIKIPEFSIVLRLKNPDKIKRRLKVAYQSFVGFLNIQLAMQGNPQFELESEKMGDIQVVSATYLTDDDDGYDGLINYNFSPSVAFVGDWFILSSTRPLAMDLAKAGNDPTRQIKVGDSQAWPNTSIQMTGKALSQALRDNQEPLIAQNMLEEGNDREDAQEQIQLLVELVGLIKQTGLQLLEHPKSMELKFQLDLSATNR